MNQKPLSRLRWQPHPEGGFIAYHEQSGERSARIWHDTATSRWRWGVYCGGESISDLADTTQSASNAANAAWQRVVQMAERAAARAEWERNQLEMIAKLERGEIDPHYFANEAANYENMMWVMDRVRKKQPMTLQIERLVEALSEEFFRRRQKQKAPRLG